MSASSKLLVDLLGYTDKSHGCDVISNLIYLIIPSADNLFLGSFFNNLFKISFSNGFNF